MTKDIELAAHPMSASQRKRRLFACACARRMWLLLTDERSKKGIEVAERYADGEATEEELRLARELVDSWSNEVHEEMYDDMDEMMDELPQYWWRHEEFDETDVWATRAISHCVSVDSELDAGLFQEVVNALEDHAKYRVQSKEQQMDVEERESIAQAQFEKDIFGPKEATIDPNWLTSTVVELAGGIHRDQAYDRLPILADALQDAGCNDEALLRHCRHEENHVRGCWVVDLLLGLG